MQYVLSDNIQLARWAVAENSMTLSQDVLKNNIQNIWKITVKYGIGLIAFWQNDRQYRAWNILKRFNRAITWIHRPSSPDVDLVYEGVRLVHDITPARSAHPRGMLRDGSRIRRIRRVLLCDNVTYYYLHNREREWRRGWKKAQEKREHAVCLSNLTNSSLRYTPGKKDSRRNIKRRLRPARSPGNVSLE